MMANQPSTVQTLKHILKMAACCAGPILGLALLAPLAGTLGIGVSSVLSTLLVLACPLSMLFMMYFMMREQKTGMQGRVEEQPLQHMPPADAAVAMAEGNGQPVGREALPIPKGTQPSLVIERTRPMRQLPKS
jgi:hypothetical protein